LTSFLVRDFNPMSWSIGSHSSRAPRDSPSHSEFLLADPGSGQQQLLFEIDRRLVEILGMVAVPRRSFYGEEFDVPP
jgi:hypothetical protein